MGHILHFSRTMHQIQGKVQSTSISRQTSKVGKVSKSLKSSRFTLTKTTLLPFEQTSLDTLTNDTTHQ